MFLLMFHFFYLSAGCICALYEAVRNVLHIFLGDMSCIHKNLKNNMQHVVVTKEN